MTYYEELGISTAASSAEIRKAFRSLTRVLHPDKQQDAKLRRLAEAQMKRLNEVVETLCDPKRRALYDETLAPPVQAPNEQAATISAISQLPPGLHPGIAESRTPVSALAAGLVFGSLLMYSLSVLIPREGIGMPVSGDVPMGEAATMPVEKPSDIPALQVRLAPKPSYKAASKEAAAPPSSRETSPSREILAQPVMALASVATPAIEARKTEEAVQQPVVMPVSARSRSKFEGIWLHANDPQDKPAKWAYKAEYVELRVEEIAGEIVGAYRSRYRIPDKPAQPEIAFRFRGPAAGPDFTWQSSTGVRGSIRLQLQGDNVMEASWRVRDPENLHGLAAGSATLVRRLD